MKRTTLAIVLGSGVLISGCFPTSINPLYTEQDVVFDPALTGAWRGDGDADAAKETWAFEKAGDNAYKLVHTAKDGKTGQFNVHRLKLGDAFFLDLFPADREDLESKRSDVYQYHFVPVHSFARLSRADSSVQLSFMSLEWLGKLLEKDPQAIRHEMIGSTNDQMVVLTASTADLQRFVLKHLREKEAFLEPINLKPKQAEPKKEG